VIRVNVTARDIRRGTRKNPRGCAVVLAVRRAVRHADVSVSWSQCRIRKRFYRLPDDVQQWIRRFDLGRRVKPIRFTLSALA